jgi:hypothetical protein
MYVCKLTISTIKKTKPVRTEGYSLIMILKSNEDFIHGSENGWSTTLSQFFAQNIAQILL